MNRNKSSPNPFRMDKTEFAGVNSYTLPTAEILSGKNVRAWVSMVLYLKNK